MAGPAPIRIRIGASLESSVAKTFDDVTARARKSAEQTQRITTRSARETSGSVQAEYNKQLAALNRAAAAQDRLYAKNSAAAARAAAQKARADERAAAAAERAVIREQAIRERAAARQAAAERRAADAAIREAERVARAKERAERRAEERARSSAQSSINRFADRAGYLSARFAMPYAPLGSIAKRTAGDLIRGAGVDLDLSGIVSRNVERQSIAVGLSNAGYTEGAEGRKGTRVDPDKILKIASDSVKGLGLDPTVALQGLQQYVKRTGELGEGLDILPQMAALAASAQVPLNDLMQAAGAASTNFKGVADKAGAMDGLMRNLIGQGKIGAVEMEDFAKEIAKIAPQANRFEGGSVENMKMLAGLAQMSMAQGGATSAQQASTSVGRLVDTLATPARAKGFKEMGIEVETTNAQGMTVLRNPVDVILESLAKTNGAPIAMKKLFAASIGARPAEALSGIYRDAGGGQKGIEAARAELEKYTTAGFSEKQHQENLKAIRESDANKSREFQNSLEQIVATVQKDLLPKLVELAPMALNAAHALGDLASWAAANPWKAVGAALVASVARAGLDSLLSSAVSAIMARAGAAVMARLAAAGWASAAFAPAGAVAPTVAAGASRGLLGAGGVAGAGMLGKFLTPTVLGKNVGAMGGMGAMLAAYAAWAVADDQNDRLKKVSGGMGFTDIVGDMFDQGTWDPAEVVKKRENADARQRAVEEGRFTPDGKPVEQFSMQRDTSALLEEQQRRTADATDAVVAQLKSGILKVEVISPVKLDAPLEMPPRRAQ